MSLTSPDFESGAYTNFATPAAGIEGEDNKSNALRSATNRKMPGLQRSQMFMAFAAHYCLALRRSATWLYEYIET